jgi:hypothetical protein
MTKESAMMPVSIDPRPMVLDEFLPLIGLALDVDCAPRAVTVTLIEAYPSRHPATNGRPGFLLIFRSAPDTFLVAGSYVMQRGAFGPAAIDIAPVAPMPGAAPGHYYQAVFN